MKVLRFLLPALLALLLGVPLWAATVELLLPLGRTAYQTNELIDLAVVRADTQALPATPLSVVLTGANGSQLSFTFPAGPVALVGNDARATEHLHLNGWLLRPGKYTVQVSVNGATAQKEIELFSHLRKSSYTLLNWGSGAHGAQHIEEGEDGMGFNLIYGDYRPVADARANAETTLRGGADYMNNCTMGGAHQMDLRMECDWSDPYVTRGGTARVVAQAFASRVTPNCLGVHFYDEPGLTWWTDPKTGGFTPHNIPSQDRAFKSAFGMDPLQYNEVKPDNPDAVAKWNAWSRWKESFMEAAWKEARAGVDKVNPNYLSATQSQYAWNAYTDGYYFNVARSLPVISGHGGYDDGAGGYLYPDFTLAFARMRDLDKPDWYLPTWYNMTSDKFRLEQNMSFMEGIQGMATPPWFNIFEPQGKLEAQGVVECNKTYARLGTIFTAMPVNYRQVAVLYSFDQCIDAQIKSGMQDNYEGGEHARAKLLQVFTAMRMLHTSFFPVVEEDILDGTLAAHDKVLIIAGVNTLDAKVLSALQGYIAGGGTVIVTDDSQVQIPGAVKLGVPCTTKQYNLMYTLWAEKKTDESLAVRNAGDFMKEAEPVANALQGQFAKLGVKPDLDIDSNSVFAARHVSGDFEYLFALNATFDFSKKPDTLTTKSVSTTISVPADGRPIYDALHSGVLTAFKPAGKTLAARFSFGPGQMRVFARTARPIGGVQVFAPTLSTDYTVAQQPVQVNLTAQIVDTKGLLLFGTAPLQVRLLDPLGVPRYDLYRASQDGMLKLTLPLAVNDPAGKWTVEVTELLANTTGRTTFNYAPPAECGALLGSTQRAVYFGDDREKIFKFFRDHQEVTLVKGSSDFDATAADRLAEVLKPWGVRCSILNAADVNKPRVLSADEAATWVGMEFGKATPGDKNTVYKVGFAVSGPVVLIGNPTDNPLIAKTAEWSFLPYPVTANFPGRGRGYIAWQFDAVGIGQDSLTAIATDAQGMAEAVGSIYEAAAGIDPIMQYAPPASSTITPATKDTRPAGLTTAWQLVLPDRPVSLTAANGQLNVLTTDGTLTTVSAAGKQLAQKPGTLPATPTAAAFATASVIKVPDALAKQLLTGRSVKQVLSSGGLTAINYWGGTLQLFAADNTLKAQQQLPQDIAVLAWNGKTLAAGLADGTLVSLNVTK